MQAPRATALEANINVTPLVDVCLVLLIIFMVLTPVIVNGVPVQLPKTNTSEPVTEATRQLSITVRDDGTLFVGASVLRSEQLAGELDRIHRATPDRPVSIRGDKRVPYGEVVDVLDACRTAGFQNVGLISEKN
ncbi:MAG: biopolymer transport protein TolR [Acidobacteriota bacterium]|jgi:biopolymer transport protein TolR|nr:biopolymer transport protein TolR [Acidobacteriota bacterium]